jgi:hypothetical protein
MTIWLNAQRDRQPLLCRLLLLLVKYISDRLYLYIILGIVPQLRYNYKLGFPLLLILCKL